MTHAKDTGVQKNDQSAITDAPAEDARAGDVLATKEPDMEASETAEPAPFFGCCAMPGVAGQANNATYQGIFGAFSRSLIRASSLTAGKRLVFIGLLLLAFSIIVRHFFR